MHMKNLFTVSMLLLTMLHPGVNGQTFDGVNNSLSNLYMLSDAQTTRPVAFGNANDKATVSNRICRHSGARIGS